MNVMTLKRTKTNYRLHIVKVYTRNSVEWDLMLKQSLMRNQSNGNNRQSQTNFIEI